MRVRLRRALAPPSVYPLTCTKGETSGAAPARPETRRPVARPLRPLNMSELEILTLSASARGQGGERSALLGFGFGSGLGLGLGLRF